MVLLLLRANKLINFVRFLIFFLVVGVNAYPAYSEKPDTLVEGGYDQREMDLAIQRARKEVEYFIEKFKNNEGESFAVKVPIEDAGKVEHFWLTDISFDGEFFTGRIGNDPGIVSNVVYGQSYKVLKAEISDWLYFWDDKMYGNYTMRPLLRTMPDHEAEKYRAILADS